MYYIVCLILLSHGWANIILSELARRAQSRKILHGPARAIHWTGLPCDALRGFSAESISLQHIVRQMCLAWPRRTLLEGLGLFVDVAASNVGAPEVAILRE